MSRAGESQTGPNAGIQTEEAKEEVLEMRLQFRRPRVRWGEDVVDNEHMNKKKSKSRQSLKDLLIRVECCIFHKKRRFDESDSESGSDEAHSCDSSCHDAESPSA